MMQFLTWALLVGAGIACVMQGLGIWSAHRHLRMAKRTRRLPAYPSVSLLKPIKGVEEALEDNLRSFFRQDYPGAFEIVFASSEVDDLGMVVARRIADEFPTVPVRFVRSDPTFGLNPKVANLEGALSAATHDLVLQSDANVRVERDYLRRVVEELTESEAHLLSSVVIGTGERSIGAIFENLQLTSFIAPAMCAALHIGGVVCVVGKSMLFRRSELRRLGGLNLVRDILCEDFILGRAYQEAGMRAIMSPITVTNINRDIPVERFLSRHSRWLKMRAVVHAGGFLADLFANPVALVFFAFCVSGFDNNIGLLLLAASALKMYADASTIHLFRADPMPLGYLAWAPIKDIVMGFVWIYAAFSRSVRWRGRKLVFGKDSVLTPDERPRLVRVLARLLS